MMNPKAKPFPLIPLSLGTALLIVLFWAYWPVLNRLFKQLLTNEDYSFGLLLPLVSGYIVYLKWPEIRRCPWRPSLMGVVVLALGLGLYIVGEASTDVYTPCVSFIVSLSGLIFVLGGWRLVRVLGFPLLLLFLMIPLPGFLTQQITLSLQLLSSRLATEILQILGIPAIRQGNIIDLGVRQLQIVSACSGLRYILALSALGIIFCYFYQRRPWKAALLLLSLVPAAIIANALRVAAMGISPAIQEGFWHGFSGWLIFVFCFGFLSLLNWVLNFLQPGTKAADIKETSPAAAALSSARPSYSPYLAVALIIVVVAGYFAQVVGRVSPVPLLQSFDNFPLQLGPWQGTRSYIDPEMFRATGANEYLSVDFHNSPQGSVYLWIAYYENQKGGGSVHSPFSCLTGSGWSLIESGITNLAPGLPVRFMLMEQGGTRYLIYYWYLQRGRWLTSEYLNKFYLSYDGVLSRRADGALIRLITPAGTEVKSAQERLNSFAKLIVPVLPQFIAQ
jgi:exosortase D (VPLPA-CTERM-specific)